MKSKALIEQYDDFEPRDLPGEKVNGALTVGENIGDLGGLTIGHKAFVISAGRRRLARGPAVAVPELGLRAGAPSAARSRSCSTSPSTRTRPPEFRANIVRNLDEFHEVFETVAGRRALARARGARPDLVSTAVLNRRDRSRYRTVRL